MNAHCALLLIPWLADHAQIEPHCLRSIGLDTHLLCNVVISLVLTLFHQRHTQPGIALADERIVHESRRTYTQVYIVEYLPGYERLPKPRTQRLRHESSSAQTPFAQ